MSVIDEVKARIDIVTLIESYSVTLHKSGRYYKANCPFHQEKTPSFIVWPDSGSWRCFGACGEGGDIFRFVMKQENVDFASALRLLAERAGIELHPRTPEQNAEDAHREKLLGLLQETATFFAARLWSAEDAAFARDYVIRRGLNEETIQRFQLGYAPAGWRHVIDHLVMLGYQGEDLLTAGIANRSERDGRLYERFRNRLMIPIRDPQGAVIGFGARALDPEDNPKYLNSPQTPLFDKGRTLFALDSARRAIREREVAVIVEGYMDAIQAHQAGFENVVAQMGTALSPAQISQLTRYARQLVLALDPDAAGAVATLRELNIARQQLSTYKAGFDPHSKTLRQMTQLRDIDLRVLTVPDELDPDDFIREYPDRWPDLVAHAQPLVDYVIETRTAGITTQTPLADREILARELLPDLLESDLQQQRIVQQLALKLRINERDLMSFAQRRRRETTFAQPTTEKQQRALARQIEQGVQPNRVRPVINQAIDPPTPVFSMESYCLAALIRTPRLWSIINRRLAQLNTAHGRTLDNWLGPFAAPDFTRVEYQALLEWLREAVNQDEMAPMDYLHQVLPGDFNGELDHLLSDPLDLMIKPGTWQARELESIRAAKPADTLFDENAALEVEFIEKALYLRQRRLRRERDDLYYAQTDGLDSLELRMQINRCHLALRIIDQAIAQTQNERIRPVS